MSRTYPIVLLLGLVLMVAGATTTYIALGQDGENQPIDAEATEELQPTPTLEPTVVPPVVEAPPVVVEQPVQPVAPPVQPTVEIIVPTATEVIPPTEVILPTEVIPPTEVILPTEVIAPTVVPTEMVAVVEQTEVVLPTEVIPPAAVENAAPVAEVVPTEGMPVVEQTEVVLPVVEQTEAVIPTEVLPVAEQTEVVLPTEMLPVAEQTEVIMPTEALIVPEQTEVVAPTEALPVVEPTEIVLPTEVILPTLPDAGTGQSNSGEVPTLGPDIPLELTPTVLPTSEVPVIEPTAGSTLEPTVDPLLPATPAEALPTEVLPEVTEEPVSTGTQIRGSASSVIGQIQGITLTLTQPDGTALEVVTDEQGGFVFDGLLPGDYTLSASTPGALPNQVALTLAEGEQLELPPTVLSVGDLNQDGQIDMSDVVLLAANYNYPADEAGVDLNGDAWIDVSDLAIIGAKFGAVGPLPWM